MRQDLMLVPQNIITIQGLNHFFGENELRKQVLFDIDLSIQAQEFVILTGPSGSGKSTLLSLIGCLRAVQSGSLKFLGQELNGADAEQLIQARRSFGYVTQASNLLNFLTAAQNVEISLELHPDILRGQRQGRSLEILAAVGLSEYSHQYPENLSGGQRQRVAIASALGSKPKVMLADEPTAALDRKSGRNVVALMHRLAKEHGSAVLMVTHDNRILDLADRIINVEDGRLGLAVSQELSIAMPGINLALLDEVDSQPMLMPYGPGEVIIQQGDPATKFYVITEGTAEVWQETPGESPKLLRRMSRGEYFGEIGLLQGKERTVTVRAAQDSEVKVMVIDESLFRVFLADSEVTKADIARRLQQRVMTSHLAMALPNLSSTRLTEVLAEVDMVRYGPNSNIANQGEPADWFYVIAEGKVVTLIQEADGRERILKTLQVGDYFGDSEVSETKRYTITVRVPPESTAEVMVMNRDAFCNLMAESHTTQAQVASVMRKRLLGKPETSH